MTLTPAEKQRRYRERLKKRAAAGDEKALKQIKKTRAQSTISAMKANCKRYLVSYATQTELKNFKKIIEKRLD